MKKTVFSMQKAFTLSFIVHMLFCGGAVVFGSIVETKTSEPIIVVMAEEMPGGSSPGGAKDPGFAPKGEEPAKIEKKTKIRPIINTNASHTPKKAEAAEQQAAIAPSEILPTDVSSASPLMDEGASSNTALSGSGGSVGGGGGGFGFGSGGQGGSGGGTGKGHGTGSGDGNVLVEQYLAEHYAYIQKLINKHLKYPHLARKMGWKGKVVVAFLIRENGNAENSKILASSGYEILDKNVLSVIKEVQPFPKPPVKAELIIPVTYKLTE